MQDDTQTFVRRVKVAGSAAQEIVSFASDECDGDDAQTMMELVNAVALSAAQLEVPLEKIVELLTAMLPVAAERVAEWTADGAPRLDA